MRIVMLWRHRRLQAKALHFVQGDMIDFESIMSF